MTIEFRYARFGEYHSISKFLDEYWARDYIYVRTAQLFEWTFGRKSLWDQEGYSFALAEDRGEIVGIQGGIPFVFNCLGKASRAIWLVNYMVRPDYRRGPVAFRLLSMFRRLPYNSIVAFGVTPSVIPIYRTFRWRVLSDIPRHFVVLPEALGRMVNLLRLTYTDWEASRAEALARSFRLAELPRAPARCIGPLPSSWNNCDWQRWASRTVGAARDRDYLAWRYLEHPRFDYRFIMVPEGNRTGLAVWRLETIRRATPQGVEEVDRIGRLVEFLPASRNNARDLLSVFWQELYDANASGADYYGYHGEIGVWLSEFGFHGVESHPDGQTIPSRFQPLERRGGRIMSAVFVQGNVPSCSIDPNCLWYWTKSDSDQDRPN